MVFAPTTADVAWPVLPPHDLEFTSQALPGSLMRTPRFSGIAAAASSCAAALSPSLASHPLQVSVVPNTFPFPDCHGVDCQGVLV